MKRLSLTRRASLAGLAGLVGAPAIVRAQGANGVALVIGNSKYTWEAQLPNVRRDAPDVARSFQALGLKTDLVQDAGRDAMLAAIERFKSVAAGARLAAVYFAGHGVSWDKQTYVVPVDADLSDPRAARSLVSVPSIDAAMQSAANRLLVFDSCRNNPADGWKQREARALARVEADDKVAAALRAPNTLTLFSTASGAVALDGPAGANSPFAAALLRQLDVPSLDLQALPPRLRRDLLLATDGRQLVWDQNTFAAPFVIAGSGKPSSAGPRIDPSRIVELPKAYAFAQQAGLLMPPGLVALRPAANTPDARMIGSFKYDSPVKTSNSAAPYPMPHVINVLSVSGTGLAEVVIAGKDYMSGGSGNRWRYASGATTGNSLSVPYADDITKLNWEWRDQGSGSYHLSASGWTSKSFPFTRLDG